MKKAVKSAGVDFLPSQGSVGWPKGNVCSKLGDSERSPVMGFVGQMGHLAGPGNGESARINGL